MTNENFNLPPARDIHIGNDAWGQISSHLAVTPARMAREDQIAAEQQRQVGQLIASGAATRPLRRVRTLSPPFKDAILRTVHTEYDGTLGVWWSEQRGENEIYTRESETGPVAELNPQVFPNEASYVVALPGGRWLGSGARVDWPEDQPLSDGAWIIDGTGGIVATGCLGDAHLRPVVTLDGRILVSYFDEHPDRGCDGAWTRNAKGEWEMIPDSVRPVESVDEYSDFGRYTAGYTGMTVFDDQLRVMGRHSSPTDICEVYAWHTDGERFWYVSYPEWQVDVWDPDGQGKRIPSGELKGAPLICYGDGIARFSGPGEDRDTLYTITADNNVIREVVTFPDGTALRQGDIATWGRQLHYLNGAEWFVLDVF